MEQMNRQPPDPDEVEFSVFGRGFGESLCIHQGGGEWIVVDSCLNPNTGTAAALTYLTSIGVRVEQDVRLVVATHWDDDHVRGLADVVEACADAYFACSA